MTIFIQFLQLVILDTNNLILLLVVFKTTIIIQKIDKNIEIKIYEDKLNWEIIMSNSKIYSKDLQS